MDTQEMALLLIAGILLVAIVVVNTATPVVTEEVQQVTVQKPAPAKPFKVNTGIVTRVFVYDPVNKINTFVEVK